MMQTGDTIDELITYEDASPVHVVKKTTHTNPSLQQESPPKVTEIEKTIVRFNQIVWYITGIIEALLGFRVLLKAFGANPFNGFTSFIYATSHPFALPFQGIFGISSSSGNVIEWSTLFAMLIYTLIAYGLVALSHLIKPVTKTDIQQIAT